MPYREDEEEAISGMKERGIPKAFSRWAVSYLSGSGYDHQTIDIEAYYDNTLTFEENKAMFKREFPSQSSEQYASGITKAQMKQAEYDVYKSNLETRLEEKKYQMEQEEAEKQKKRDWVKEKIEESTKVKRSTGIQQDGNGKVEITEEMMEEPKKERDFLGKIGGFFGEVGEKAEAARVRFEKEREFGKIQRQKKEKQKLAEKKEQLAEKLEIAGMKRDIRGAERSEAKSKVEEVGYALRGGAYGERLFGGFGKVSMGYPAQRPQRSRLAESLDISGPRAVSGGARNTLRDELDMFRKGNSGRGLDLNIFQKQEPQQKHKYRQVIEGGKVRRERIPIKEKNGRTRGNSMLGSLDIFGSRGGMEKFQLKGRSLSDFDLKGGLLGRRK